MRIDHMHAGNICKRELITADESESIAKVARLMRNHGVGDIVLTKSLDATTVPIGFVTDRDIVVHAVACNVALNDLAAGDLRLRELVTVDSNCDIFEITRTMNENAVRRLIVSEESVIIGIVTLDDVLLVIREIMNNLSASLERQIHREKESYNDSA